MEAKKTTKIKKTGTVSVKKAVASPSIKTNDETLAVLYLKGSQYLVKAKDKVQTDLIEAKEGSTEKAPVLILDPEIKTGTATYKVLSHFKGPKIRVATYKAKSRHRKVRGSRSHLTEIQIEKIEGGGK